MQFAIVCEAPADRQIAADLADRQIQSLISWIDGNIDALRTWVETVATSHGTWRLEWKQISKLAKHLNIRMHGHFDGQPAMPDASVARRAIQVLRVTVGPNAIVLIRDADNQGIRRAGLEQARQHFLDQQVVVIGLAIPEREAWVLAGFIPADSAEETRLNEEKQLLGFDPTSQSIRLTALTDDSARQSPKRALKSLSGDDYQREQKCWCQTDLTTLKSKGNDNGLREYLDEIERHLVPLFTGQS